MVFKHCCTLCPRRFHKRDRFIHHHRSIHCPVRFMCKSCEKIFTDYRLLRYRHQKENSHSGVRYVCVECEYVCENEDDFDIHRISIHPSLPPYLPQSSTRSTLSTKGEWVSASFHSLTFEKTQLVLIFVYTLQQFHFSWCITCVKRKGVI